MAKYKGIVKIEGKLYDLSFYELYGKPVVRRATVISRERILNEDTFQRTRENMSEFAASSMASKALRSGLALSLRTMGGKFTAGRFTGLMRKVCALGAGTRGARDLDVVAGKAILEGYNINPDASFASTFSAPYSYTSVAARNAATLTVPDFDTRHFLHVPQGATHFKLVNAVTVLSNYTVNASLNGYAPTDPALNMLHDTAYSALLPIGSMLGSTVTLTATLPGAPVMTASVGLVGCVGIEFYQVAGSSAYLLASGNGMRVEGVF